MNDTLDLPPIEAPAMPVATQPAAPEPGTLKATALASFVAIRSHAAKLAEKYRAVAYDVTTPKGMAAAKDARLELREEGRFAVQRLRDRLKDEANDLKRVVTDEAEAVIKIIAPVEDAIHAQITAEEERKKAEKAEAARILAECQQKQSEGVAGIRAYLSRAQTAADMTAERVGNGIKMLEAMTFAADDWLDPVAAANAQCETLEGMRALQATLLAREIEADRLEEQRRQQEAERADLERQAAAMRAEQARIARLQAMIAEIRAAATGHEKATAADLYEARIAVAALDTSEAVYQEFSTLANATQMATLAVLDKFRAEATDREAAAEILELRSEHQKLVGALIDVGVVKDGSLPEPTMTLGEFNTFIAPLRIDAAGLELLGFRVARTFKAAKYYNDTDKAAMVAAMVKHLQGL